MKKITIVLIVCLLVASLFAFSACSLFGGGSSGDAVGIESIKKTGTKGLVDTYTITLTDGSTSTFTVTNGKSGSSSSSSSSTGDSSEDCFYFIPLEDGTYSVIARLSDMPRVTVIPETYNGKKVTAIGDNRYFGSFGGSISIEEIVIPASITTFSTGFYTLIALSTIRYQGTLAQWIQSGGGIIIGENTGYLLEQNGSKNMSFYIGGKKIEGALTIPSGITKIEDYSFQYFKDITSVTIPSGVTEIGSRAFYKCTALRSVTIPATVSEIRETPFSGCSNLTSITYQGTKAQWNAISKGEERYYWHWDSGTGDYTIHCTDGDIAKE